MCGGSGPRCLARYADDRRCRGARRLNVVSSRVARPSRTGRRHRSDSHQKSKGAGRLAPRAGISADHTSKPQSARAKRLEPRDGRAMPWWCTTAVRLVPHRKDAERSEEAAYGLSLSSEIPRATIGERSALIGRGRSAMMRHCEDARDRSDRWGPASDHSAH